MKWPELTTARETAGSVEVYSRHQKAIAGLGLLEAELTRKKSESKLV